MNKYMTYLISAIFLCISVIASEFSLFLLQFSSFLVSVGLLLTVLNSHDTI